MKATFFVKINLPALRQRLAAGYDDAVTNDDVVEWLTAHGFRLGRIGWYAAPELLELLRPYEVLRSEQIL